MTDVRIQHMNIRHELNGTLFVWNAAKAQVNIRKHDGITFEQAAQVFFDPLFRLVDASRSDEAREAVIGLDEQSRILFVVGAFESGGRAFACCPPLSNAPWHKRQIDMRIIMRILFHGR